MPRLLSALVPLLALVLVAAAPLPLGVPKPVVVVFPYSTTGNAGAQVGMQLATVIANELATDGNIKVIAPPSGVDRKDYLAQARSQGADYYIAGSLWAIGNTGSLVSQVVSAQTGIVVFSNSAPVSTAAEAAAQADTIHDGILAYVARNIIPIQQVAPPAATPAAAKPAASPTPKTAAAAGPHTSNALFGHHSHPAAAPSPSPSPT